MARSIKENAPLVGRYLSDTGLSTGVTNMREDTLAVAKDYYITALEGEKLLIGRMIIHLVDVGSFDSGSYGNALTLVNGIYPYIRRGLNGPKLSMVNGDPIFSNSDWEGICFDSNLSTYGSGNQSLVSRWSFSKYGESEGDDGIILNAGDQIGLRIKENLVGLTTHHAILQGQHLQTPHPSWQIEVPI